MERKRKKINLKFIVLILSLIVFLGMSVFTFAWFTDTKSYTGTLNFGELKLKVSGGVSGDGVTSASSKIDFDVTRSSGPSYTLTKKVMPGDTININLTIDLEAGSDPAYYVVQITDEKNIFENNLYFSDDGTNVYVYNGTYTYKQGDTTKTMVEDKYCGTITAGSAQNLKISAKVSEDYTTQKETTQVVCNVFAIQRANLEPQKAINLMPTGFVIIDWELGSLSSGGGYSTVNDARFRTTTHLTIDDFEKICVSSNYRVSAYCWDSSYNYLGTTFFQAAGQNILKSTILSKFSTTKYIRFAAFQASEATISLPEDLIASNIKIYGNCELVTIN